MNVSVSISPRLSATAVIRRVSAAASIPAPIRVAVSLAVNIVLFQQVTNMQWLNTFTDAAEIQVEGQPLQRFFEEIPEGVEIGQMLVLMDSMPQGFTTDDLEDPSANITGWNSTDRVMTFRDPGDGVLPAGVVLRIQYPSVS